MPDTASLLRRQAYVAILLRNSLRHQPSSLSVALPALAQREVGWLLVQRDVFRAPPAPVLLSACVGSGVQLVLLAAVLVLLALAGRFGPEHPGGAPLSVTRMLCL